MSKKDVSKSPKRCYNVHKRNAGGTSMYNMESGQVQQQKQSLSRNLVQSAEILQMDVQELREYIQQEALENPLIELEDMDFSGGQPTEEDELCRKLEWLSRIDEQNRSYYSELYDEAENRDAGDLSMEENDLSEYVLSQLLIHMKSQTDRRCLEFLVYNLDSKGYLSDDIEELQLKLGIDDAAMARYLTLLRSAEPAGVGAGSLEECLQIQIARRGYEEADAAALTQLAAHHLSALGKRHFAQISEEMGISLEEIRRYYGMLQELNPIPGNSFSSRSQPKYLKPDVAVIPDGDHFEVIVNDTDLPQVTLCQSYLAMMGRDQPEEVRDYLRSKYKQVQWVQHCIEERTSTLLQVTKAIVQMQPSFFAAPDGLRQPMGLKDIAQRLNIHESTVSRTVKNKYLQCPRGLYPMSYFFTQKVTTDPAGTAMTPEQVKEKIQDLIREENRKSPSATKSWPIF